MSEILPSVDHRSRAPQARGPLAWLADRLVPSGALRWGRLTGPPPLEVRITVDLSGFERGMAVAADRTSEAFERLARTMDAPGKRTADAFVPAQFDGWWQP